MRYTIELSITASTTINAPARDSVTVAKGTLVQVTLQLPAMSAGQVHTWAERGGHQIVPANRGGVLRGEDDLFVIPERLVLDDHPLVIDVYGYNSDDAFAHLAIWHFDVIPDQQPSGGLPRAMLDAIRGGLGLR